MNRISNESPAVSFSVPLHQFVSLRRSSSYFRPVLLISVSGLTENNETCWPGKELNDELIRSGVKVPVSVTIITLTSLAYSARSEILPIVWSSLFPVAPTITISLKLLLMHQLTALVRSLVSCPGSLKSRSEYLRARSLSIESRSPTTASASSPVEVREFALPSQQIMCRAFRRYRSGTGCTGNDPSARITTCAVIMKLKLKISYSTGENKRTQCKWNHIQSLIF